VREIKHWNGKILNPL